MCYEDCESCQGSGIVEIPIKDSTTIMDAIPIDCPACGGTGKVEV